MDPTEFDFVAYDLMPGSLCPCRGLASPGVQLLACDYAWSHPNPSAIATAGYKAVLRYLSTDPSKDLSLSEAQALHAADLGILCVWETTAQRATQGYAAGRQDAEAANAQADALSYPPACVIFYAVDEQVTPAAVKLYFKGLSDFGLNAPQIRPVGGYGDAAIIDALVAWGVSGPHWQTAAWSGGALSENASLYQRVTPTLAIAGAAGEYDEDVILKSIIWWGGSLDQSTPPLQEDDVKPYLVAYNGAMWVVAPDLSSRTGITDEASEQALNGTSQYLPLVLSPTQMLKIPDLTVGDAPPSSPQPAPSEPPSPPPAA